MKTQQRFQTVGTTALKSECFDEHAVIIDFPPVAKPAESRNVCENISSARCAVAVAAFSLLFYLIAFI